MNSKGIAFGMGMVLVVLAVFAAPAVADSSAYFVPQHGNGSTGDVVAMTFYADIEEGQDLEAAQFAINFDRDHANIVYTDLNEMSCGSAPTGPDQYCWGSGAVVNYAFTENGSIWGLVHAPKNSTWISFPPPGHWDWQPTMSFEGPVTIEIARYWVEADGTPGASPVDFGFEMFPEYCPLCQNTALFNTSSNSSNIVAATTWENGTFTHEGEEPTPTPTPTPTFTKELKEDWNLISLPLTMTSETDMTVANIIDTSLTGSYDELYKYDTTTHCFVSLISSDTLENGVGYFIHMTSGDTWTYSGDASNSMNVGLSEGLNMVGWLNCSKDITDALSSVEGKYRYVARWDATSHKFEVYVPDAPAAFNDFSTMGPGVGYFVSMKTGETLEKEC